MRGASLHDARVDKPPLTYGWKALPAAGLKLPPHHRERDIPVLIVLASFLKMAYFFCETRQEMIWRYFGGIRSMV